MTKEETGVMLVLKTRGKDFVIKNHPIIYKKFIKYGIINSENLARSRSQNNSPTNKKNNKKTNKKPFNQTTNTNFPHFK